MLTPRYVFSAGCRLIAFGLVALIVTPLYADTLQVVGLWSDPVLAGNIINVDHSLSLQDNTNSADYSINNVDPATATPLVGSALNWGADPVPPGFSNAVFFGNSFATLPLDQPNTVLGTLTFLNGTSLLNTLIFGATLNLSVYVNGALDNSITPLSAPLGISTTVNSGTCDVCDADFISFNPPVALDRTMNVFESNAATFEIQGEFVSDPHILITNVVLAPGQTGGFIGQGPLGVLPEPATCLLLGTGLLGLGWFHKKAKLG